MAMRRSFSSEFKQEAGFASKQTRKHRYRIAEGESRIAPNHLNRAFEVNRPDAVWWLRLHHPQNQLPHLWLHQLFWHYS